MLVTSTGCPHKHGRIECNLYFGHRTSRELEASTGNSENPTRQCLVHGDTRTTLTRWTPSIDIVVIANHVGAYMSCWYPLLASPMSLVRSRPSHYTIDLCPRLLTLENENAVRKPVAPGELSKVL